MAMMRPMMMRSNIQFSFRNFISSNGPLRVIITIVGLIVVGLGAGKFTSVAAEIYFITVAVLSFILSLSGSVLSFLEMFKIERFHQIDWMMHLYACWFLFNSSVAKLISASVMRQGTLESEAAVQVLSGVFGMFNSVLFGWLAYVTHSNKQSFPCRLSANEVNEVDDDMKMRTNKGKPLPMLMRSNLGASDWSWRQALTCSLIAERVRWHLVFDEGTRQARLFTLIIGLVTTSFVCASYYSGSMSENYFVTVTCLNFCVTLIFHLLYFLGVSQLQTVEEELGIFDKSFHVTGGLFLSIGGILMLGSTIETNAFEMVQERTFSAVVGILNGILYGYIGLKQNTMMMTGSMNSINKSLGDGGGGKKTNNLSNNMVNNDAMKQQQQMDQKREREKMLISSYNNPANIQQMGQLKPALIFDPQNMT